MPIKLKRDVMFTTFLQIELKSKKEKIVIENLKKKNCNRANLPKNTLKNIPKVATENNLMKRG